MTVNTLPIYPESRELTISDYQFIIPALKEHEVEVSDVNFTNVFAWRFAYDYRISQLNGMIILHGIYKNAPFFLVPIGKSDQIAETAYGVFRSSHPEKIPFLACVLEDLADELTKKPGIQVAKDRDNWDYIFKSSDLAELPGQKYHAKKNLIRQFTAKFNATVEELTTETCKEAMDFSERWCKQRDCESNEGLEKEKCAIYQMLTYFEALRLHGLLVRIDDEIVGLTMGEELNDHTYMVHVEKGDTSCRGIYQFINRQLAQTIAPKYPWINREQDLGIQGIRRAKTSYHPDHFIEKYRVDCLQK